MGKSRGQSSIEFLYSAVFMLCVFGISSMLFLLSQSDVSAFAWHAEAMSACRAASGQMASVASLGPGAYAVLSLPKLSGNYSLRISGPMRTATVSGSERLVSCPLALSAVTNGTSEEFYAQDGSMMRNTGEVVLFE